MAYVDGFVMAVPKANRDVYRKHAEEAAILFKEHGALQLVECWGDDVPDGEVTSFSNGGQMPRKTRPSYFPGFSGRRATRATTA